jgi:hypothetical protein
MRSAEFWISTPGEVFLWVEGYAFREELRVKNGLTFAWMTANLGNAKRLPPLQQILNRATGRRGPQISREEAGAKLRALAADMAPNLKLAGDD